ALAFICILCAYLIYRLAVQPHLLSFPTRRSSDLPWPIVPSGRSVPAGPAGCTSPARGTSARHSTPAGRRSRTPPAPAPRCGSPRSEEHTSELQSREKLVCRLLLETNKYSE